MIGVIFQFGSEVIKINVNGDKVYFQTGTTGFSMATIENLRIDKNGTIKEFPDLKDNPEWRSIAVSRFKEKMENMKTEEERVTYLINDLKKFGYKPMYKQRTGFRVEKIE